MKIKKKELRKGLAQLPINYPAPTVADGFNFEREKHRVEDVCKKLAHVEVEVRDAALAEMPRYLQEVCTAFLTSDGSVAVADVELLLQKLSMGLFYCFWHSDKPLVQHECAFKIAQLMNTIQISPSKPEESATMQRLVIESMFRILSREWGRIDRYRLDKYMSLVRKLLYQMLILTKKHYEKAVKAHMAAAAATAEEGNNDDNSAGAASSSSPSSAAEEKALIDSHTRNAAEQAALNETPFITDLKNFFQKVILVEPRSVGLTMHLMDICLDEFIRSDIDVALFIFMAESIPLFAMTRGDFIEKRVLDNFIGPIVSGVLDQRRVLTIATSPEALKQQEALKKKKNSSSSKKNGEKENEEKERNHSDENDQICLRLSMSCQQLAVSKETRHHVRPLLSEAQMLLEQRLAVKLNPKQFRRLTYRDMRRRVTKELQEAEENADKTMKFRKLVKDERREIKKKARKLIAKAQSDVVVGKKKTKKSASATTAAKDGKKTTKRITIDDADAAGHEAVKKTRSGKLRPVGISQKKSNPLDPTTARELVKKLSSTKEVSGKVKEEMLKIARKAEREQSKKARLQGGESEAKVSTKGFSQNSKRHKYGKLTKQDILEMETQETPTWKKKK